MFCTHPMHKGAAEEVTSMKEQRQFFCQSATRSPEIICLLHTQRSWNHLRGKSAASGKKKTLQTSSVPPYPQNTFSSGTGSRTEEKGQQLCRRMGQLSNILLLVIALYFTNPIC
ncbi:hypothetical protein XELAEV_18006458mg [Xenopus laevis]|uniref:Uncharacterized protein n=1 Tax=Xenopus laevis TaxID=8355 RepID=A0A974DZA6_XENLA|nr:hypothetical protein XELAEV_18006458mg [Xenopus laevis]